MAFLIDTDVLIDISRGSGAAADFVDNLTGDVFIARISAMELIIGARDRRDQDVIEKFISLFQFAELSEVIGQDAYARAKRYFKISRIKPCRRSHRGDRNDERFHLNQ